MTINFYDGTNHDGLFDVLGKVFYAQSAINTSRGATVRDELTDILTQVELLDDSLDLTAAVATVTQADQSFDSGGTSALQQLQQVASNLLVEIVNADTPLSSRSIDTAIAEMLRQMEDNSETVDASTVTASVADIGSPTGDGVFIVSVKRGDGRVAELAIAETLQLTTTTAGPAAAIQFLAGAATFNLFDADWPDGSGVNTQLASVEGDGGVITNGEFDDESTDYPNVPENWIVLTGTAGTTLLMTDVEVQTIALAGTPTGGYYLLHWTNSAGHTQTTEPIPFDADGGSVQSALQSLTGLDGVDVTTTGTEPDYTHTIMFTELGGNVSQFTSTNRMTGATSVNEKQRITVAGGPDGGTFTLTYAGQTTAGIDFDATASEVATALVALSNIDAMIGTNGPMPNSTADMEFGGSLAGTDVAAMTITTSSLTKTAPAVTVTTTTVGGTGGVNEVQTIVASGVPSGGTWTITYSGQTTSALVSTANAAAVQAALEALSNLAPGDVVVTGGTLGVAEFVLTFGGALAATNLSQVTIGTGSLLGPNVTVSIATITAGSPSQNEVQSLSLYGTPTGGTFTLTFNGQTTAGIVYNCTAGALQTALEALSNIAPGDIVCAGGAFPGTAITVTFAATYAATSVPQMTVNAASLTGGGIYADVATTTPGVPGLSSSLVSFWKLDETSGDALDAVGANDLTPSGTVGATTGHISGARTSATVGNYLANAAAPDLIATTDFSLAGWVNMSALNGATLAVGNGHFGIFGFAAYWLYFDNVSSRFKFSVANNAGAATIVTANTFGAPATNTWYFVAVSFNRTTKELRISIDNGTADTATLSGTVYALDSNPREFDLCSVGGAGSLRMDEWGYWSRVLAAGDITALYNSGTGLTTPLSGGTNEVQQLTTTGTPSHGTFTLTYSGQTTTDIANDASAATVEAALAALSNIASGDATCTGGPLPTAINIEFTGVLEETDVALITADSNSLKAVVTTTTEGNPGTNEVERISAAPVPVAGTFTLTYDGQTTSALDFDATASEIDAALEALSNIGAGDVTVTGGPINSANVTVTFTATLAATNVAEMTATSSLTGASPTTVTPATTTEGVSPSNETQSFTLGPDVTGGTYTLTWHNGTSSQTTAAIAYNASFDDIRAALEATSTIAPGDISVGGGPSPAAVTVTFQGAYAGLNVDAMTGSGASLTQDAIVGTITTIQDGSPDSGSITHLTTISGTPQVYSGAKSLILKSNGSELTAIQQRITGLQGATPYSVHLWVIADAVPAAGVLKIELIDGTNGSVLADDQGTQNVLTFNASALTTSWKSLTDLISGECVFRLPTNVPSIVYLRLRISTAVTSGRYIYLDRMTMSAMQELYAGGPWVSVIGGADPFVVGDRFTMTVANDRAGLVQEWFARNFNSAQLGILLPSNSAGGETIPDSVVS